MGHKYMAGIINKIITLYEMEASEISSLVTNSQKVFKNFTPEDDRGPTTDEGRQTTTEILSSVLCPQFSDPDDTFEKKLDKEIKRMEAFVKERLKPFDNAQGRSV